MGSRALLFSVETLDVGPEEYLLKGDSTLYAGIECAMLKQDDRNATDRMKIWYNSFLAILLAVTMVAALVAPHGANAMPRSVSTDEGSSFQLTSAMTSSHHGSSTEAMDDCLAMQGHCATVLCRPHRLGHPNAAKVDIHRTTFKAQFYGIFSSVDTPPPRA